MASLAHRTTTGKSQVDEQHVQPSNPLQSDFAETASMDSDEQYLVRFEQSTE